MLTKLTELRKASKNLTAQDIEKSIEHLTKILTDKKESEQKLLDEVNEREAVRLRILSELEENKLPIPNELRKPVTILDVAPRRRKRITAI